MYAVKNWISELYMIENLNDNKYQILGKNNRKAYLFIC